MDEGNRTRPKRNRGVGCRGKLSRTEARRLAKKREGGIREKVGGTNESINLP